MSHQREVPQFINIEDKIAFQLTAKQLGWIGLGGFFGFMAWVMLEKVYFLIVGGIILIAILAILFIKPYGQTLPVFVKNAFFFVFKPRVYIWKKGYQNISTQKKKTITVKKSKRENKQKTNPGDIKKAIQSLDIYE